MDRWHIVDTYAHPKDEGGFTATLGMLAQNLFLMGWGVNATKYPDGTIHIHFEGPHEDQPLDMIQVWAGRAPLIHNGIII